MNNDQINSAVHEARGGEFDKNCEMDIAEWGGEPYCVSCHIWLPDWNQLEHKKPLPDYTDDPRLFWPLLDELLKLHYELDYSHEYKCYRLNNILLNALSDAKLFQDKDLGVAVCLVYLKMKGVSVEEYHDMR